MGLDLVELVMDVEAKYDIELPDESLERALTLGGLHDLVLERLQIRRDLSSAEAERLFSELAELALSHSPLPPGTTVHRQTHLIRDLHLG